MQSTIEWFEIPAVDFDRAVKFYDSVLGVQLRKEIFAGMSNGIFPYDQGTTGGAVVFNPAHQPGNQGTVVYLSARGDLDGALSRVPAAGGRVIMPKTAIGDPGYIAIVIDTEGNKVGLHQEKE
jgi:predicted enzyme related to lactoylglutathione lyase